MFLILIFQVIISSNQKIYDKRRKERRKERNMFDIWFYFFIFLRCEKVILPHVTHGENNFLTKNFLSIRRQKINSFGDSKKKSESFAIKLSIWIQTFFF